MASKTKIQVDPKAVKLRPPKLEDVDKLYEMFEKEHWMVGKTELNCWLKSFPEIFLIAEYEGKTIGCINVLNMSEHHAYIGNYVIDEPYRYQGIGKRVWATQVANAGSRSLILTSEKYNFPMYSGVGFQTDKGDRINRYLGVKLRQYELSDSCIVEKATKDRINAIIQYDTSVTSLQRADYVTKWVLYEQTTSYVAISNGKVVGYIVMCLYKDNIYRIGPLFTDSIEIAKNCSNKVLQTAPEGATFTLDADPMDTRLDELISNRSELEDLDIEMIHTKADVPLDKNKSFFYSQLTMTRT